MTIGAAVKDRLLELCRQRGITGNKLATLSNIKSGRNNSMTSATIKKLCDGPGIPATEFFDAEISVGLEQEVK